MKTLVIAEKPSVAQDIAKVLKCSNRGDGFLFSDNYIVSWAVGHLVTLCEPEDYDKKYKSWRRNTLPIIPESIKLKPNPKTKKQLDVLGKLMKSKEVSQLICATDSGREGELIFRYIYDLLGCSKPFQRLWISSMTDQAIREGIKNLKDGSHYDNLYYSAKCRSEADWLVGINATRAYTIKYNTLLSVGRVQTPTLAILTERQKEINAFVPQKYFELRADFGEFKGIWFDPATGESKIAEKAKAEEIAEKVLNKEGIIEKIEVEEKKQPPSLLYDLTELQRDCNRRFGFSASKTLGIAQDLYEKRKLITYPRTDSRYLSDDMRVKIPGVLKKLQGLYGEYVDYILGLPKLPDSKRMYDNSKVTDHHAIIPTEAGANPAGISADEKKVYDLVARKFLAAFYPSYVYNITKITSNVQAELFMTKGTTILKPGWTELYKKDGMEVKKKNEDEEAVLPKVEEGDVVNVKETELKEKKTQAPKPYTEATLLSAMENASRMVEDEELKQQLKDSGLGTPSTRAAIIERLLAVGYIERKGKNLLPTDKGMGLIEVVPEQLRSPETTGKWEKGLTNISRGKMDSERFMGSIKRYVYYIVESAEKSEVQVSFPEETRPQKKSRQKALGLCPLCGKGEVLENSKGFYCSSWKSGCKFTIWKNVLDAYGGSVTPDMVAKLIVGEKIGGLRLYLPQTKEGCTADLILKDKSGFVELVNLVRV